MSDSPFEGGAGRRGMFLLNINDTALQDLKILDEFMDTLF